MVEKIKSWYWDLSIIRKNIFANFINIMIPLVLLSVLAGKVSSEIIIKKTITNSEQNMKLAAQSLDSLITNSERTANIIVANNGIQDAALKLRHMVDSEKLETEQITATFLDSVIEPNDKISSAIITFGDYMTIVSGKVNQGKLQNAFNKDRNEFDASFAGNNEWLDLHNIQYEKLKEKMDCISYKKKVIEALSGRVVGAVVINIDEEIVSRCYSNLKYSSNGRYFIINSNGKVLSSTNKDELYKDISKEDY
jgi:two-component system, sensor histidine kinase YesM